MIKPAITGSKYFFYNRWRFFIYVFNDFFISKFFDFVMKRMSIQFENKIITYLAPIPPINADKIMFSFRANNIIKIVAGAAVKP